MGFQVPGDIRLLGCHATLSCIGPKRLKSSGHISQRSAAFHMSRQQVSRFLLFSFWQVKRENVSFSAQGRDHPTRRRNKWERDDVFSKIFGPLSVFYSTYGKLFSVFHPRHLNPDRGLVRIIFLQFCFIWFDFSYSHLFCLFCANFRSTQNDDMVILTIMPLLKIRVKGMKK